MVTEVDVYQEIRRLQLEGVVSKREAARRLGISRNTVKKYWDGDVVPWERKVYTREAGVITAEVRQYIVACLDEDDSEGVKKQKHTAQRIYDRLIEETDFKGGASSVRRAVHEITTVERVPGKLVREGKIEQIGTYRKARYRELYYEKIRREIHDDHDAEQGLNIKHIDIIRSLLLKKKSE